MQKPITNTRKIMIKIKNRHIFNIGINNLCGWAILKMFPVNNFEWVKDTSQLNEDFIKSYNEENDEGYFLEVDVQYLEKVHGFRNDLPVLPERMKIEKIEKLVANLHDKTEYVRHIRNLKQGLILH